MLNSVLQDGSSPCVHAYSASVVAWLYGLHIDCACHTALCNLQDSTFCNKAWDIFAHLLQQAACTEHQTIQTGECVLQTSSLENTLSVLSQAIARKPCHKHAGNTVFILLHAVQRKRCYKLALVGKSCNIRECCA